MLLIVLCQQILPVAMQVSVVPDDLDQIADEVRRLSPRYSFVLTTGGVGPTHDDITLEGEDVWNVTSRDIISNIHCDCSV